MLKKVLLSITGVLVLMTALLFLQSSPDIPVEKLIPLYTTSSSHFLNMDGMDLHYRDEGRGKPIVLLHGFMSSLQTWDNWTEKLTNSYRVIRMDLPGAGLTGPWKNHPETMSNYINCIERLLVSLSITNFAIAGNSFGGRMAWEYTVAHPEKVEKLVLLDASGYPEKASLSPIFGLAKIPVLNQLIKLMTKKKKVKETLLPAYYDKNFLTEARLNTFTDLVLRAGNRDSMIRHFQISEPDDSAKISTIRKPALILWGEKDEMIPAAFAERFHRDIMNSSLIIYTNAGHLPMEEASSNSVADLMKFLSR